MKVAGGLTSRWLMALLITGKSAIRTIYSKTDPLKFQQKDDITPPCPTLVSIKMLPKRPLDGTSLNQ